MEENTEEINTTEEEVVSTPTETVSNDEVKQSYVKIREEKARQQIFKALGVKNIDEAKEKLDNADKALEKVQEIEKKLEAQETEKIYNYKIKELTKILDNEHVFDSDALVNYIDLDSFDLQNGRISDDDAEGIVNSLKRLKPKYFGTETVKSDEYQKTEVKQKPVNDYADDYNNKNYLGVIAKYLQNTERK